MKRVTLIAGLACALSAMNLNGQNAVGIGDVNFTPNYLLHVNSSGASGTVFQLSNATTGSGATDGFQINLNAGVVELINRENTEMRFYTNNLERGRVSAGGQFMWGNTAWVTGDKFSSYSDASNGYALNGMSSGLGAGVYGEALNNNYAGIEGFAGGVSTNAAGILGYTTSANVQMCGVSGQLYGAGNGGANFQFANVRAAIRGNTPVAGARAMGIMGYGGVSNRSGAILGNDYNLAWGALGYLNSGGNDFSVYGFGLGYNAGAAGGMLPDRFYELYPEENPMSKPMNHIGIGMYGGVMGGWVRGMVYGMHLKGQRYGLYVDGTTFTNSPVIELVDNGTSTRTPAYHPVSLQPELTLKGRSSLQSGSVFVPFGAGENISQTADAIITVTALGDCKGLFVEKVEATGFWVKEMSGGNSSTAFNWMAVVPRNADARKLPEEVLGAGFDNKMDGVMFNENNTEEEAGMIWWDGNKVRFDKPDENTMQMIRGKGDTESVPPRIKRKPDVQN